MEFNGFKPDMGSIGFYLEACQYQHSMDDHLEFVSSINGLETSFCNILNASSIQRNFSEINGCSSTGMENIIDQTPSSSGLLGVNSMTTSEAGTTPIATHQYHHGMQFDGNWPLGVEKPLTTYGQKPISGTSFLKLSIEGSNPSNMIYCPISFITFLPPKILEIPTSPIDSPHQPDRTEGITDTRIKQEGRSKLVMKIDCNVNYKKISPCL